MSNVGFLKDRSMAIPSSVGNKFFLIHCLLASARSLLLLGFIGYQFIQPLFLNSDVYVLLYMILFLSFSLDFMYFYFHEKIKNRPVFHLLYLFLDAVLMTVCLSIATSALYSVLVFVYILQIFSAGVLGRYKWSFMQGLLSAFLFSWVLILSPSSLGAESSLAFSFLLNNLGFLTVAGLSGFIGQETWKMQWSLAVADKATRRLENLNKLIVENINMGLFILDEDTFIIHSNQVGLNILNLSSFVVAPVQTIFPELREHIVSNPRGGEVNRLDVEYKVGSVIKSIELFICPIKEPLDDSVLSLSPVPPKQNQKHLILFQDCTDKREMEKKAHEKERHASIGRMAMGIAHELRNPLSSIGGSIQLLDLNNKHSKENKKLMDIALSEVSRLNRIIGEFLDYASNEGTEEENWADKVDVESLNVDPVLEELLDTVLVNPKWEHIKYHFTLKSHGLILGNRDKFKQIFLNIVKNACEAMEGQSEGRLEVESFDDKEWVVVRVKDTGVGISEKDKPYIYDPFYSKKDKGTGLGLSIVRKWVLFYKGHISYESHDNKGTLCVLRFPIQPNHCPGEMAGKKTA